MTDEAQSIAAEVLAERDRQDEKWGEQNHPDGTGPEWIAAYQDLAILPPLGLPAVSMATVARASTDRAAAEGLVTWAHILFEEVTEAFAEEDVEKLRTELVQVAAVAQQWVQAIDRRAANA